MQEQTPRRVTLGRMDSLMHAIFNYANIDPLNSISNHALPELHAASEKLFGTILSSGDPRWRLAAHYARIKKTAKFSDMNLLNAQRADYSSKRLSRYAQHLAIGSTDTLLQLSRALTNLEIGSDMAKKFEEKHENQKGHLIFPLAKNYFIRFEKTRNLQKTKDRENIMGGPFALWQLQLFNGSNYIGRIGYNFHIERGKKIATINVIQGAEESQNKISQAEKDLDAYFGKILINHLKTMLGSDVEYRGIKRRDDRRVMYNSIYRSAKVKTTYPISRLHPQYRNN